MDLWYFEVNLGVTAFGEAQGLREDAEREEGYWTGWDGGLRARQRAVHEQEWGLPDTGGEGVAVLMVQHQAELTFIGSQVFGHKIQDLIDGFLGLDGSRVATLGDQIDAGNPQ